MPVSALTPEQIESIKSDLREMGVSGSSLLAIPPLNRTADYHDFIRTVLLSFLRALFRSMPDEEYRWDPDPALSKIVVQYADPRHSEEKGKTPAVTLELGPFTWGNHTINNLLYEEPDGTRVYTDLRNGSAIIRCRSSVKLEADSLAAVISGAFHFLREELEDITGVLHLDAYTSNPSSPEQNTTNPEGEFFVSNVVVNIHYQESWKRKPSKVVVGGASFCEDPKGVFLD